MPNPIGLTTKDGWLIRERVSFAADHTGGFFSECFFVERAGARAFLKLMDITSFKDLGQMMAGLNAFDYEAKLLTHTTQRRLSRVVHLLESGQLEVDPGNPVPVLRTLPYLVFERGEGDIRKTVDVSGLVTNKWRFCVLHRAAAGLFQLHQANIAHQDLKPSNLIQIRGEELKIGDLGRSSMRGDAAPHDGLAVAGALPYAPFELSYSYVLSDWVRRRIATDVFHLGCLAVFVFTNVVLPGEVFARLDAPYRPDAWGDSYDGVIPHLKEALVKTVDDLTPDFPSAFRDDLTEIVLDTCNPDPSKRGERTASSSQVGTSLWLQKFVSKFDRLEKRAGISAGTSRV